MKASDNEIEEMKMNEMETNRTPMTTPMVGKNLLNTQQNFSGIAAGDQVAQSERQNSAHRSENQQRPGSVNA